MSDKSSSDSNSSSSSNEYSKNKKMLVQAVSIFNIGRSIRSELVRRNVHVDDTLEILYQTCNFSFSDDLRKYYLEDGLVSLEEKQMASDSSTQLIEKLSSLAQFYLKNGSIDLRKSIETIHQGIVIRKNLILAQLKSFIFLLSNQIKVDRDVSIGALENQFRSGFLNFNDHNRLKNSLNSATFDLTLISLYTTYYESLRIKLRKDGSIGSKRRSELYKGKPLVLETGNDCSKNAQKCANEPQSVALICRIQVRLLNGKTLVFAFNRTDQLKKVVQFVQANRTDNKEVEFYLAQHAPKRQFTEEDMESTLQSLGLMPSASWPICCVG